MFAASCQSKPQNGYILVFQPTQILEMPSHTLNPTIYQVDPRLARNLDVGFRGAIYPYFIGDMERTRLLEFFRQNAKKF